MRQAIQMPIKAAEVVASGCSKIAPGKARDGLRQMVNLGYCDASRLVGPVRYAGKRSKDRLTR